MKVKVNGDKSVTFKCPGCGKHHTLNLPDNVKWNYNGDMHKPTIYPAIICKRMNDTEILCHCVVKDGIIQFLSASKHHLAGHTVELPDLD